MRFPASSRHQHPGFAVTMVSTPPPPSALRFSQPLGGLLPTTPCGLVSSRWHVQASPFRGFPSPGAATARRRSYCLLAVTARFAPLARRSTRSPTSRPCSPGESVATVPRLSDPCARSPLGLHPLQGLHHLGQRPCFHDLPLSSLPHTRTGRVLRRSSGSCWTEGWVVSRETTSLL